MPAKKKVKTAKKKTAKKVAKKVTRKPAKKAKKVKRAAGRGKANAAFMKPMTPDAALAAVVGEKPLPRTMVTKKVWDYIKSKGLQDKTNRRMINADENLMAVFGGKRQVNMFEMTKLVNKHLK